MTGFPGKSFLEKAVLAIFFLLTCPPTSVQKEGRRRTLRRLLRELDMCPLSCAVVRRGGDGGRAWGLRDRQTRVALAAKWRKAPIAIGLTCAVEFAEQIMCECFPWARFWLWVKNTLGVGGGGMAAIRPQQKVNVWTVDSQECSQKEEGCFGMEQNTVGRATNTARFLKF